MDILEYNFSAIPSGDHESFCFDVDKKTFKTITGREPLSYDKSYFNNNLFRIYPGEFFDEKKKLDISIKINKAI